MSQNINIRLSSNVVQLSPGEGTVLAVTVINNGRGVERLELSVNNIDPGWLVLDQNELLLYPDAPGNEGTVNLQVMLPITALPGSYSPTIDIRNAGDIEISATAQLVLVVNQLAAAPGPEFHLVQDAVQTKHRWARFQLQVNNPLDLPQTLKLYGRPSLPSTRLRIIPPVVEMPPRGQGISVIELEPAKRNRIRPGKRYDFMVAAENAPGQANGYMIQTASLPLLAKILATPFLLVLSILLPLLIIGAVIAFILLNKPGTQTNNQPQQSAAYCVKTNLAQTASLHMGGVNTDIMLTDADTGKSRRIQQEPVERLPGLYSSLLSVSPNGTQLAYVTAANEAMDDAVIYTVSLSSGTKQRVAGVPSGFWPTHPIWSNDSTQLGYVVRNGSQLDFNFVSLTDKKVNTIQVPQMTTDYFYGDPGTSGPLCFSTDNTRAVLTTKTAPQQTEINLADRSIKVVNKPATAVNSDKSFAPSAAGAVEPALAPLGDSACQVKTFSQNDPLWRDLNLKGTSDLTSDKIGAAGCALTSAAMMLNYFKVNTDPNELNACMGTDASALNWNWSKPAQNCSDGLVSGAQRDYFSWDGLNQSLSQGQPAVVGLLGGQTGVHFVVVVGGSDSLASTYRVNDPWDGTNYKSLAWFISRGYQLQWLISFTGANPPVCKTRVTTVADTDPNFKLQLTSPEDGRAYSQPINVAFNGGTDRTTATLYQQSNSATGSATTTTAAAGPDGASLTPGVAIPADQTVASNGQVVQNGEQVTGEGAYQLVLDSPGDNGVNQRLTSNFTVDFSPPIVTRTVQGAFESNLSATGAQIAHGNVTMQLKATDSLSGIASIEYMVNGGPPQPYTNDVNPKPVTFSNAGDYDITYKATDGANNVTQTQEWKFTIVANTADIGPNGSANGGNGTQTTAAAVTTPPASGANNGATGGSGGSGGSGGDNGGGGGDSAATTPAATTAAPTTPAATTAAIPPAVLVAAPTQLAFDATMENTVVQINVSNSGGEAANITIVQPTGPAAGFLKFTSLTGTVPAGGALPIPVQLVALNYTAQAISGSFSIVYNGTALPIAFSVAPQPAPTIAFTSPASGPISKTVQIKLTVTSTGAAKPNHINLSAKYLDKVGGTAEERTLPNPINASSSWTYNWDLTGLPPQEGIELHATVCWSADDSNCFKAEPNVTGLTIPKPSATIALDPNNASLSGKVNIVATPSGGPLDHITYSYIYKQGGSDFGPITITDKATAANQYKVVWDTSSIPPQEAAGDVKLNALVCWTGADSADSCTAPASITPAQLTVDKPTIAATALSEADAKNLPLTLKLNGTIAKLTNPSATVWVQYSVAKTWVNGALGPTADVLAPATMSSITNGTALWSASIDTSNLPPQTINFFPKVCWDGNPGPNPPALYCYPVAVPLVGVIPEIVPAFVDTSQTVLSDTTTLSVTTTPAGRASVVKYLMSYTKFNQQAVNDVALSNVGNKDNNYTITFDSVALGLKPEQTINFKLVACNDSGYCSKPTAATPFTIPASTLNLSPTADSLQSAPLTTTVVLSGTLSGRNVTNLQVSTIYTDSRIPTPGPYTRTANYGPVKAGTTPSNPPFPISLDMSDVPPQNGISIQYKLCWQGSLDSGCAATVTAYSGLRKDPPGIDKVMINGDLEYNPTDSQTQVLPIPYSPIVTQTVVELPITAVVTDTKINKIQWKLEGVPGKGNQAFTADVGTTTMAGLQGNTTLLFDIKQLLENDNDSNEDTIDYYLKGYPYWQNSLQITDTSKIKIEPIKLITFNAKMKPAGDIVTVGPLSNDTYNSTAFKNSATMISGSTEISLTDFTTSGIVTRAIYNVSYDIPPNPGQAKLNVPITSSSNVPLVGLAANDFKITWDHTSNLPKIKPQSGIILGWRLCNTPAGDDSGCLPTLMRNSFNQVINLTLGGIRFEADPTKVDNSTNKGIVEASKRFFNSSFDANMIVVGGTAIKSVRLIAYPTIGASTNITDAKAAAAILSTHENPTTSNDKWSGNFYFSSPDTPNQQQLTQNAKLLVALGNNHMNMTLATQMCTIVTSESTPLDDPHCSDWTGATESLLDTSATAQIAAKMAMMVVWKPLCTPSTAEPLDSVCGGSPTSSTADPYNQFVQDGPNTVVPTRTLTLKIYRVPGAANVTEAYTPDNLNTYIKTYYTSDLNANRTEIVGTPNTQSVFAAPLQAAPSITTYFIRRDWNIRSVNFTDESTTVKHSVKLSADVSFEIDASKDANQNFATNTYTVNATVPTKGRNGQTYCNPSSACTVIGSQPTTPANTTAPSTTVPSTTAPSTTAPSTTAPPTTAPPTTGAPTTAAVTTAPSTTAPSTTTPAGSGNSPSSA